MGGGFNQAQNFCQMGMQQQAQQPEDPTKAPRFCPECGDPFDSGDLI